MYRNRNKHCLSKPAGLQGDSIDNGSHVLGKNRLQVHNAQLSLCMSGSDLGKVCQIWVGSKNKKWVRVYQYDCLHSIHSFTKMGSIPNLITHMIAKQGQTQNLPNSPEKKLQTYVTKKILFHRSSKGIQLHHFHILSNVRKCLQNKPQLYRNTIPYCKHGTTGSLAWQGQTLFVHRTFPFYTIKSSCMGIHRPQCMASESLQLCLILTGCIQLYILRY